MLPHNFALYTNATATTVIFKGEIVSGPIGTATYKFTAPATPGTYYFRCDVHPAINGKFVVTGTGATGTPIPTPAATTPPPPSYGGGY